MEERTQIEKTIAFVKETLQKDRTGHDFMHIMRVYDLAKVIAKKERVDLFVVELASLLHDIKDHKFTGGDSSIGANIAFDFLCSMGVEKDVCEKVREIILHMSYKGGLNTYILSKEGQVVQDADRLDAIGAIGIARAFTYGGSKGRSLYDPSIPPQNYTSVESYVKSESSTINHFYEKLLKLKDGMNTETARQIANHRHQFMEKFLEEFYREWKGEDLNG